MTNSAKVIVIQLVVWYDFSVVDSDKSGFVGKLQKVKNRNFIRRG